ncbi:MAG TPA: glycosyltransferase, partial [Candidatus Micrarchaeota archaeon]|nr:glycosyltransferase [Candidatus Micrarchaeota archaeon]
GYNVFERQRYAVEQINANLDALIVNSAYSRSRFEALGINPDKMHIVSGGVDAVRFFPPDSMQSKNWIRESLGLPLDSPVFFSAVRLVPFKSVSSTIEAFGIFASEFGKKAFLIIAGSGMEQEMLREKAKALPANAVVIFNPPVQPSQIHLYFMASDVYVQTPVYSLESTGSGYYVHTETMGRSFCEAASCGVPSVSFNSGGSTEIIRHGKTGFVSGHDTAEFAGYMAKSLARRNELSQNAREHALSALSWDSVFSKYEVIFDGLQ